MRPNLTETSLRLYVQVFHDENEENLPLFIQRLAQLRTVVMKMRKVTNRFSV